eukprot:scaffold298_cov247-Pinguiococcus_pyrenoidosus.AAC.23
MRNPTPRLKCSKHRRPGASTVELARGPSSEKAWLRRRPGSTQSIVSATRTSASAASRPAALRPGRSLEPRARCVANSEKLRRIMSSTLRSSTRSRLKIIA